MHVCVSLCCIPHCILTRFPSLSISDPGSWVVKWYLVNEVKVLHIYKCQPISHVISSASKRSGLWSSLIHWSAFFFNSYSIWEYVKCIMEDTRSDVCCPWFLVFLWMLFSSRHSNWVQCLWSFNLKCHLFFLYSQPPTLLCSVLLWACASAFKTLLKSLSGLTPPSSASSWPFLSYAGSSSPSLLRIIFYCFVYTLAFVVEVPLLSKF